MRRQTPLVFALAALLLLAAACTSGSSSTATSPTPSPTDQPTVEPTSTGTPAPTATATPAATGTPGAGDNDAGEDDDGGTPQFGIPEVVATGASAAVALGEGTYCWTNPGGPGLCADTIGIITPLQSLAVVDDQAIELRGDLDWTNARDLRIQIVPRPAAPVDSGDDWLAFRPEDTAIDVPFTMISGGVRFMLPAPGAWLLMLSIVEERGDANYGLLVERRASDAGESRTVLGLATELPFGVAFLVEGTSYHITLAAIDGDSRCPVDVTCVTAGETRLTLLATKASGDSLLPLTVPNGGEASADIDTTYRVRVLEVRPEPRSTVRLVPLDYSIVVVVERADLASTGGGVRGVVTIGPICPVQREGFWCPDRPFAAELVIRAAGGDEVERIGSGDDGWYELALEPGSYVLDPLTPSGSPFPIGQAVDFTVSTDSWTDLDISYDSGIR